MKATIEVVVNLDPVPGWGHQVEDFVEHLKSRSAGISHYVESVRDITPSTREEVFQAEPAQNLTHSVVFQCLKNSAHLFAEIPNGVQKHCPFCGYTADPKPANDKCIHGELMGECIKNFIRLLVI